MQNKLLRKYFKVVSLIIATLIPLSFYGIFPVSFIGHTIIFYFEVYLLIQYLFIRFYLNRHNIPIIIVLINIIMFMFAFIGSLNYFTVKFIFPDYNEGIEKTTLYWILYNSFLNIGYLLNYGVWRIHSIRYRYSIDNRVLLAIFFIGTLASIYMIVTIGFIPSFTEGSASGTTRFFKQFGGLTVKAWYLLIPSGLIYYYKYLDSKNPVYFLFFIFGGTMLATMVVRFPVMLYIVSTLFLYLVYKKFSIRKKLIVRFFIIFVLFMVLNNLFLSYRTGEKISIDNNNNTSIGLSRFLYSTFNEYRQLNQLIDIYDTKRDLYMGETLLNFPVAFFPQEFWDIFNIEKGEIRENNSALILMRYLNRERSGIRNGLAGEFYINFGFAGFLLALIPGFLLKYLDRSLIRLQFNDVRTIFILIYGGILVYALINGQMDAISSNVSLITYFFIIFIVMSKKIYNN
ncbi:MAG: oligosaccharide repeat unit polymerase [Bacteroidales bacterium]|nr:oligosaccharide repeat unit polymerase [Bacteroidales bacterium]